MFWTLTLSEVNFVVRAVGARIEAEFERHRMISHELAALVGVAFHAPEKMKSYEPIKKNRAETVEGSPALGEAKLRGYLMFKVLQARQEQSQ